MAKRLIIALVLLSVLFCGPALAGCGKKAPPVPPPDAGATGG